MLKTNCYEYSLSEKIYNALFSFVLEYIHKFHMLSQVKQRNSLFKRIEININIIQHPNVKSKIALNIICQKKYTMPYSTVFFYYIQQLHMLFHIKYRNSIFKRIDKNVNIIQAPQCLKQNFSEHNLSEKIYNVFFYSGLQ